MQNNGLSYGFVFRKLFVSFFSVELELSTIRCYFINFANKNNQVVSNQPDFVRLTEVFVVVVKIVEIWHFCI